MKRKSRTWGETAYYPRPVTTVHYTLRESSTQKNRPVFGAGTQSAFGRLRSSKQTFNSTILIYGLRTVHLADQLQLPSKLCKLYRFAVSNKGMEYIHRKNIAQELSQLQRQCHKKKLAARCSGWDLSKRYRFFVYLGVSTCRRKLQIRPGVSLIRQTMYIQSVACICSQFLPTSFKKL